MASTIPRYADFKLRFEDIKNDVDPQPVDLSAVQDIVLSMALGSPSATPLVIIKYTESPLSFVIDNTNKIVVVEVLAENLNFAVGKMYANLWIISNNRQTTHIPMSFDIKPAIKYSNP